MLRGRGRHDVRLVRYEDFLADPRTTIREVAEFAWIQPHDLARAVEAAPWAFSPWLVLQARELELFR